MCFSALPHLLHIQWCVVDNVIVPILQMRKWSMRVCVIKLFQPQVGLTKLCLKGSLQLLFLHLWNLTGMVILSFKLFVFNWEALTLTGKISIWSCLKCSLEPLFPLARYFNLISYLNCVIFFCIRYYTIKETHTYSLYS